MKQVPVSVLVRAGSARRSGKGIVLSLGDRTFYIPGEEMVRLFLGKTASLLSDEGDWEGTAWLSPVLALQKHDLTILVQDRLFMASIRDVKNLLEGGRDRIGIREYCMGKSRPGKIPAVSPL
ncbi:MAG: hypothetical protein NQU46_06440 [Methanolinea sp.]|nr:hypothetical protein [Methanolinea sp.]